MLGNCGFGFAPVAPDFRDRSMLTMTRTEAIPYESMRQGMPWDWETIPEYLDSLDRAPKGVNVIQYMPTASLMTYVMGLEAAKSRPATDQERKEMQRLLHEGMEAGLAGFSIQRLGPNSVQADFDGTPMVTDTMVDEDILALAEVLAERDEGSIQITQADGPPVGATTRSSSGSPRSPSARCSTTSCTVSRNKADVHRKPLALGREVPGQGPADLRPVRHGPRRVRLHARALEPLRRLAGVARRHDRHEGREDREDAAIPELRQALVDEAEEADRRLQVIQAGVGGDPAGPRHPGRQPPAGPRSSTSGAASARSPRPRASTRSR